MTSLSIPKDTSSRLAIERTWLAHERTMMAWVRTGTSMISFGFTIYKFFDLQPFQRAPKTSVFIGPREFALIMIGTGVMGVLLATLQHRRAMKTLAIEHGFRSHSVAGVAAGIVSVMGLGAFIAALLHG